MRKQRVPRGGGGGLLLGHQDVVHLQYAVVWIAYVFRIISQFLVMDVECEGGSSRSFHHGQRNRQRKFNSEVIYGKRKRPQKFCGGVEIS